MTDEEFYIELHGAAVWAMVLAVEEVRKNMGDLD